MKPKNNRVFCPGCNHTKMLFDSQSKADNFIRFNSEDIARHSRKVPSRSYFCSFCGGWHVTSVVDVATGQSMQQRDNEILESINTKHPRTNRVEEMKKEFLQKITPVDILLERSKTLIAITELHQAAECFEEAKKMFREVEEEFGSKDFCSYKLNARRLKRDNIEWVFRRIEELGISSENLDVQMDGDPNDKEIQLLHRYLTNRTILAALDSDLKEAAQAAEEKDFERVRALCEGITKRLKSNKSLTHIRKKYRKKVEALLKEENRKIQEEESTRRRLELVAIIECVQQAYAAFESGNRDECWELLERAENMMPNVESRATDIIWNSIYNLKEELL